MPMIDLTLPKGALPKDRLDALVEGLTRALLQAEGAPETREAASLAWVFVNPYEEGTVYVAGKPARSPRFRAVVTVPQGGLNDARKVQLVTQVDRLLLQAQGLAEGAVEGARNWCIVVEVNDGNWGSAGRIHRFADIARFVGADQGRLDEGEKTIAAAQ